jgi:transcriptional regulator with XRE-family HTH domain
MSHSVGDLDESTVVALEQIGTALRYLRSQHRMTQRVMADRSGLSQSTISRLENGLAPGLRLAWLARLLAGLHRDPGPVGSRPWEPWTPPVSAVLVAPFAPNGRLERLIREAEQDRTQAMARHLMQLQASLEEGDSLRVRESDV